MSVSPIRMRGKYDISILLYSLFEIILNHTIVKGSILYEYKEIIVFADNTADDTDTIAIVLADYGITTVKYVKGYTHTTEGAHIIEEAPTTSVTTGTLTITVGGSTNDKARAFLVGGF